MAIRKGEQWGSPASRPADIVVRGNDAALARAVAAHPRARIGYTPAAPGTTDVAATLGFAAAGSATSGPGPPRPGTAGLEVEMDALDVAGRLAVAHIVIGAAPSATRRGTRRRQIRLWIDGRAVDARATGVAVFNAQHLAGERLVPRGHPGDGRAEVQWYGVGPDARAEFRRRAPTGDHLDHPDVGSASFRRLRLEVPGRWPIVIDGEAGPDLGRRRGLVSGLEIDVVTAAYRLVR